MPIELATLLADLKEKEVINLVKESLENGIAPIINRCKPPALPGRLPEFDNSWNREIDSVRKIQRIFACQRLWAINNYVFTSCRDEVGTRIHHETKKGSTRI